jgi:hypothetical protein
MGCGGNCLSLPEVFVLVEVAPPAAVLVSQALFEVEAGLIVEKFCGFHIDWFLVNCFS